MDVLQKESPASAYKDVPFDLSFTTKDEVEMFLDADQDLLKITAKIKYYQMIGFF